MSAYWTGGCGQADDRPHKRTDYLIMALKGAAVARTAEPRLFDNPAIPEIKRTLAANIIAAALPQGDSSTDAHATTAAEETD